jgi:hypothetical protein
MATKKVKELEKMCKSSLIGAQGMVWVKCNSLAEGKLDFASSVSKNFTNEQLLEWAKEVPLVPLLPLVFLLPLLFLLASPFVSFCLRRQNTTHQQCFSL